MHQLAPCSKPSLSLLAVVLNFQWVRDMCCVPRKPTASIRCHSASVCLRIFCVSAACLIAAQRMALWVGLLVEKAALQLWLA